MKPATALVRSSRLKRRCWSTKLAHWSTTGRRPMARARREESAPQVPRIPLN
jgi:hypothetical protein